MSHPEAIADALSVDDDLWTEWDHLAVDKRVPLMSPGWLMPWWHHAAPANAEIRLIAVRDDEGLVGVAPFFTVDRGPARRTDYRLLSAGLSMRLSPLARAGRECEVATAVGNALRQAMPRPSLIAFEAAPLISRWPDLLRDCWPGRMRPLLSHYHTHRCPIISLRNDSFEEWLSEKSSNFRSQMRRMRRQFAADGGTIRKASPETLNHDVAIFAALHRARWEAVSYSSLVALDDGLGNMLKACGNHLLDADRFRLWIAELDGEPVSAQLFVAAGGEVHYFNGGWDERFAKYRPALLGIVAAVEDAFDSRDVRMDLGPGQQHYKLRLADDNASVGWSVLIPPGRRMPLTAMGVTPMIIQHAVRNQAKQRLSPEHLDSLRRARGLIRAGKTQ